MSKMIGLFLIMLFLPSVSAAHWIVGYVFDSADGTSPNGRQVSLLHTTTLEEVFGIVGPTGMAGVSNIYMIDCEMLPSGCTVGDVLNLTLVDDGSSHNAAEVVQVTMTGAGYDIAPNITMTTPFAITNTTVEDSFTSPENEIDLASNSTITINCTGVIEAYGPIESVENLTGKFYADSSSLSSSDDNNDHYSNDSCIIDESYGTSEQGLAVCTFEIEYYANSEDWTCSLNATNNASASTSSTDGTSINPLLSFWVNDTINFSTVNQFEVSDEKAIEIVNLGNTKINLSLSGYGSTPDDGLAMTCDTGNITVENAKYNLTISNPGTLTLEETLIRYNNLTSSSTIEGYGLDPRQDDSENDAYDFAYWRIYIPEGPSQTCQGNIIIGATQS